MTVTRRFPRLLPLAALLLWVASTAGCTGFRGTTAASFLRRIAESPDPNVRYHAYEDLASPNCYDTEEQKARAAKVLISKLNKRETDRDREPVATRAVICKTLGELKAAEARDALIRATSDPEGVVRVQACRALGKVGRTEDATVLARIMNVDVLEDCRIAAIEALGELKPDDTRILQVLVDGMEHDDPAIRLASLKALRSIRGKDLGVEPAPWKEWVREQVAAAKPADAPARR